METYGKTNDSDGWLSRRSEMDIVSPHAMSQVDLLFKEGVTGKGMKIAVIDSGVSSSDKIDVIFKGLCTVITAPYKADQAMCELLD